jgi:hypothetical protein
VLLRVASRSRAAPPQTRFCTKYRHRDGALVLKVTDDVRVRRQAPRAQALPLALTATARAVACSALPTPQCLKYKTDQASDLKKVEKMNALCLALMARGLGASAGALRFALRRDSRSQRLRAHATRATDAHTPRALRRGAAGGAADAGRRGAEGGGGKACAAAAAAAARQGLRPQRLSRAAAADTPRAARAACRLRSRPETTALALHLVHAWWPAIVACVLQHGSAA